MRLVYNIGIYIFQALITAASPFNFKARQWVKGRKNIFSRLKSKINTNDRILWFHCASLGEFEQGRPVIERFKTQDSRFKILLTFFSPSGYEVRKNYAGADYIFYLPLDTPSNAKKFIDLIKPEMAFFVKYEFWFNYLQHLKKKNIPTFLISGIFREQHYFFKWYGAYFRKQLKCFSHFFVQDKISLSLLNGTGFNNVTLSGDTRFDRVFEISQQVKKIPLVEQFKGKAEVLIGGSTWPEDEKILAEFYTNLQPATHPSDQLVRAGNLKLIIVPHEIHESHINSIVQQFSDLPVIRYTQANEENICDKQVLIVDTMGMLSSVYQYGSFAFIGGGFGKGIHNILEAATFGLPVFFGPHYYKFNEARELIKLGGAFSLNDSTFLKTKLDEFMANENEKLRVRSVCKNFISSQKGGTDIILKHIKNAFQK